MNMTECKRIMLFLMLGLSSSRPVAITLEFCCESNQRQISVEHTDSMDDSGCHQSDEPKGDFINECENLHCCVGNLSSAMDQHKLKTAVFNRSITGFHNLIYSAPRPVRVYHPPDSLH